MPQLDLPEHAHQLRDLAKEFEALHTRVRNAAYTPGSDALRQLGPLLLAVQDLTATTLVRLRALDASEYPRIAGSRTSLECLSSVLVTSALAGDDLAHTLYANPYEGTPHGPVNSEAEEESVRTARHAEAIPQMTGFLGNAAEHLHLCATGCRYVASGILDDLAAAPAPIARPATATAFTTAAAAPKSPVSPGVHR